jgi:hypothetical protein
MLFGSQVESHDQVGNQKNAQGTVGDPHGADGRVAGITAYKTRCGGRNREGISEPRFRFNRGYDKSAGAP